MRSKSLGNVKPDTINRVYEVEEHMGGDFLDELSKMHADHLRLQEHNQDQWFKARLVADQDIKGLEQQRSLPAYVYGVKLGQMTKKLEQVTCYGKGQLRGGGRIIYDMKEKCLKGESGKVTQTSYFEWDKARYSKIL